jgi:tetratricopeptide (TPR) repeat protein
VSERPDDAIPHLEKAMRLDPTSPIAWMWLDGMGFAHFSSGRYEEAVDWAQRSIQINPKNSEGGYRTLAASYAQLGRLDEAQAAVQEALRVDADLSLEKVRRQNSSSRPDFLERWLDGLRMAGLKEE